MQTLKVKDLGNIFLNYSEFRNNHHPTCKSLRPVIVHSKAAFTQKPKSCARCFETRQDSNIHPHN